MQPYTDVEIERLGKGGVKRLAVICPAFISDCLETLEEIAIRGHETFVRAGGEQLTLVPCINDRPEWITALERMVVQFKTSAERTALQQGAQAA